MKPAFDLFKIESFDWSYYKRWSNEMFLQLEMINLEYIWCVDYAILIYVNFGSNSTTKNCQ